MIKKIKNNSGISLIEILVSLTILSMLIIPITNIITTSIKSNNRSNTKQQGTLIGQTVLEQIEVLGDSEYKENIQLSSIKLPNGEILADESNTNTIEKLEYTQDKVIDNKKYKIEVTLDKNNSIEYNYENIDAEEVIPTENMNLILEFKTNMDKKIEVKESISNDTFEIGNIDNIENIQIKVMQEQNEGLKTVSIKIDDEHREINSRVEGNKIMLHFTEEYTFNNNTLNLDIYNNITPNLNIYVKKSYKGKEKISIENKQGNLSITDNVMSEEDIENMKIDNFYNIKVVVKDNDKELFVGHGNRNLKINSNIGGS